MIFKPKAMKDIKLILINKQNNILFIINACGMVNKTQYTFMIYYYVHNILCMNVLTLKVLINS